jgi:hypothetical protein
MAGSRGARQRLKNFIEFRLKTPGGVGTVFGDIEKNVPEVVPGSRRETETPLH